MIGVRRWEAPLHCGAYSRFNSAWRFIKLQPVSKSWQDWLPVCGEGEVFFQWSPVPWNQGSILYLHLFQPYSHFLSSTCLTLRYPVLKELGMYPAPWVCLCTEGCLHVQGGTVLLWLCFDEVRCNIGEPLAAPLSGWCQPVCSYTLPFFGPILPFKHLFAALTYPVEPFLPLCQWAGLSVLLTLQLRGCLHHHVSPFSKSVCFATHPNSLTLTKHDKFNIKVIKFAQAFLKARVYDT